MRFTLLLKKQGTMVCFLFALILTFCASDCSYIVVADASKDVSNLSDIEVQQTHWGNISSSKLFLFDSADTIRLEIFYSSDDICPELLLISPSGNLHKGNDESNALLVKQTQEIPEVTNIKYTTIYIDGDEAGTWKLSVTPSKNTKFLCLIQTALPQEWINILNETTLKPERLLAWYVDESTYTKADVLAAIKERQASEIQQSMQSVTIQPKTRESDRRFTCIIVTVFGIALIVVVYSYKQKQKVLVLEKKRQQHIADAKEVLAQERIKENELLEKIMCENSDSYIDYPEEADYYTESIQNGLMAFHVESESNSKEKISNNTIADAVMDNFSLANKEIEQQNRDDIINYF